MANVSEKTYSYLGLLCASLALVCTASPGKSQENQPFKVGRICVIGNERTYGSIILRQLPFFEESRLSGWELVLAEKRLARLGLFVTDAESGVHPTVEVLPPDDPKSEIRDILVTVHEKPSNRFVLTASDAMCFLMTHNRAVFKHLVWDLEDFALSRW
jgi:hypothetical protein